jgi:hypothetical protein
LLRLAGTCREIFGLQIKGSAAKLSMITFDYHSIFIFILKDPGDPDDEHHRDGGGPGHSLCHRLPELLGLQEKSSPYLIISHLCFVTQKNFRIHKTHSSERKLQLFNVLKDAWRVDAENPGCITTAFQNIWMQKLACKKDWIQMEQQTCAKMLSKPTWKNFQIQDFTNQIFCSWTFNRVYDFF